MTALEPAGFWIRAAARLIDWVVQGIIGFVIAMVGVIAASVLEGVTGHSASAVAAALEKMTFIGWIGSALAQIAYHSFFEGVAGSTVGKRMIGLQVIGMDGSRVRFRQGFKRSVGFLVDALFFGAIGAHEMRESPEKQRIGDRWADTRVVRRRSLPAASLPSTGEFMAGMICAVHVSALILALTSLAEYLLYSAS